MQLLGDEFDPITDVSADSSDDKPLYLSFRYFGPIAEKLKTEWLLLLAKYYMEKKFQVILVNGFTIGLFFNYKHKLPLRMQSSLVYKYSCVHCISEYVGMTTRTFGVTADEHAGVSFRTGVPLTRPPHSAVREHLESCPASYEINNFKSDFNNFKSILDLTHMSQILESWSPYIYCQINTFT